MFKKVKKNFRSRTAVSDDEDDTNRVKIDHSNHEPVEAEYIKKKSRIKSSNSALQTSKTLLSFADDEEESETFQIKKSSHSKKLARMEKERRKKKLQENNAKMSEIKIKEESNDDIGIVVKKDEEHAAKEKMLILNGRAALMAGKDDASSSEDEGSARFKFSRPLRDEITIESGTIPDAATIHAARKRRERARQMNMDFIPIEKKPISKLKKRSDTSRLVREEDEASDDERINMGTGLEANDLASRRENYFEHVDPVFGVDDDPNKSPSGDDFDKLSGASWSNSFASVDQLLHPPPPTNLSASRDLILPEVLTQRLRDRIAALRELYTGHCCEIERVSAELEENKNEIKRLEEEAPSTANRFRFYQDLRGYVTDLVECLDEKVPALNRLEESALKLWAERANYFSGRRRLDIRDQADEGASNNKNGPGRWTQDEEEARSRRAAEREGRRTRRRRARELRAIPPTSHIDGMSSDDEETELESSNFSRKTEELTQQVSQLMEDVEPEFSTINGIAERMEKWRVFDLTAYTEAYASICLPKMMSPFVRLQLILWNPLLPGAIDIESTPWWSRLLLFGLKNGETLSSLSDDPDLLLVPTIIEKAIVPKLTALVKVSWDPMSSSQTFKLIGLFGKYISTEMPKMEPTNKVVKALLEAVLERFKHAIDNDIFIPLTLSTLESKGGNMSVFFQRQFAAAVKLLRNILSFQGIIAFQYLQDIALDALLNKYLLTALRLCHPRDAAVKANMIISTFPRWWFQTGTQIPKLEMFYKHLKQVSSQLQPNHALDKESYELVTNLLKTLEPSYSVTVIAN